MSAETEEQNSKSITEKSIEENKKNVTLRSYDGDLFEVDIEVAIQSQTIKSLMDDDCWSGEQIPIPNVCSKILGKVIKYCKKHVEVGEVGAEEEEEEEKKKKELKKWDKEFVAVDKDTIFELIQAANYLNIKALMDLTCQTVADTIKSMTVEDVEMRRKRDERRRRRERKRLGYTGV